MAASATDADAPPLQTDGVVGGGHPNQVVSASRNPVSVPSPTHATWPSGRMSTAVGAATTPTTGSSQGPAQVASTCCTLSVQRPISSSGSSEVEQHRPGFVQQLEDAERACRRHEVEIGHPAPEQGMPVAEVVADVEARCESRDPPTRFVHLRELGDQVDHGLHPFVAALERRQRHRVTERPCGHRMALPLIGVEEALGRGPLHHLRELPAQVHRVLHTEAETLPSRGVVHVRRVAREQHPSGAVGRRLARRVGEARDPGGIVHPEVGAERRDERPAEIVQGGLAGPDLRLGGHDAHRPTVLEPVEPVHTDGIVVRALRRFPGDLDLGDQVAPRRVPAREPDACRLADEAPPAVAADEVLRAQRPAIRQLDADSVIVLREARHPAPVDDPYRQLGDPGGHDPLDRVLPDPEAVRVPGREVAHVENRRADHRRLGRLALREEPIGDAALIEHLDRSRVEPAGAGADELVVGALLDHRDVDAGQGQLRCGHHARRAAAGDHHRVLRHGHIPV